MEKVKVGDYEFEEVVTAMHDENQALSKLREYVDIEYRDPVSKDAVHKKPTSQKER